MLIVTTQNDEKSKRLNSISAVGEMGLETHLNNPTKVLFKKIDV